MRHISAENAEPTALSDRSATTHRNESAERAEHAERSGPASRHDLQPSMRRHDDTSPRRTRSGRLFPTDRQLPERPLQQIRGAHEGAEKSAPRMKARLSAEDAQEQHGTYLGERGRAQFDSRSAARRHFARGSAITLI